MPLLNYNGKEPCAGCGLSGEKRSRTSSKDLCPVCKDFLLLGKSRDWEQKIKYIRVRDWWSGYNSIDFDDNLLDKLGNDLLAALDNKFAEVKSATEFPRTQYLGSAFYNIPEGVVEPLRNFLDGLNKKISEIRKTKDEAESFAKSAVTKMVSKERTKIYNEGIARGKQLLVQLNKGEVTLGEFDNEIEYKS